jgi:hypothetical protein
MSGVLPNPSFQTVALATDPTTALQACTKEYVDGRIAPVLGGLLFPATAYGGTWDGAHDISQPIIAAIAAAVAAGGGIILLPAGTYPIASPLVINTSGVSIRGAGLGILRDTVAPNSYQAVTTLTWTGSAGATMLTVIPIGTESLYCCNLEGFVLNANSLANICAQVTQLSYSNFDIGVSEPRLIGFWMNTMPSSFTDGPGCQFNTGNIYARSISNVYAPTGIIFDGGVGLNWNTSFNHFGTVYAFFQKGDGIVIAFSDNNVFDFVSTGTILNAIGYNGGDPVIFANSGYVDKAGNQVQGAASSSKINHLGSFAIVQGTGGCLKTTHSGAAAVTPVTLTTNSTTAFATNVLHFASTTGVAPGMVMRGAGYNSGIIQDGEVLSVATTSVTTVWGTPTSVASGTPVTFYPGAAVNAAQGTYVLTAASSTTWTTTTVPAGGHSQTGIAVSGGVLTLTDLVLPISGTPTIGDTITVIVPYPCTDITVAMLDEGNSVPTPYVGAGGNAFISYTSQPMPTPIRGSGNVVLQSIGGTTQGIASIGGNNNNVFGTAAIVMGGIGNIANGLGSAIVGGHNNGCTGIYAAVLGDTCAASGYSSFVAGYGANDAGRPCWAYGGGPAVSIVGAAGIAQITKHVLYGTGSGATIRALQLNDPVYTAKIPANTSAHITIRAHARDKTTVGKDYDYAVEGMMTLDAAVGSITVQIGTPVTFTRGSVSGASFSVTADTSFDGLNITFTTPTGNSDTWDVVATVEMAEVQ